VDRERVPKRWSSWSGQSVFVATGGGILLAERDEEAGHDR
jgi:hypothetical protein